MELVAILPKDQGSLNLLWASIFTDELYKVGIRDVTISPGSRSTPLVLAFHYHGGFNIHVNVDERSSAFFALGISKGSKVPSVIVCTSGTAAANYFPAIIEADKSNVPLIIVTADRPSKLRNSGANQTIDQLNLYGNKIRFFIDVVPQNLSNIGENQVQEKLVNLKGLVHKAHSFATKKFENGPVHINFPFTKPLEPNTINQIVEIDKIVKSTLDHLTAVDESTDDQDQIIIDPKELESVLSLIKNSKRIMILCGPTEGHNLLASKVVELTNHLDVPLFADVLSDIRFPNLISSNLISSYNQLISAKIINSVQEPDLILHFGRNAISSAIENYVNNLESTKKVQITSDLKWNKPIRSNDITVQTDPIHVIDEILSNMQKNPQDILWSKSIFNMNKRVLEIIGNEIHSGLEVNMITKFLSKLDIEINLFLSNSLPIRYVDEFGFNSKKKIHVFGNRGASGIDGIVSTASGVAYGTQLPTLLLIGDLALFHDMQGLHNIQKLDINLKIIVINNNGGGIFRRLPISKFAEPYELYFNTPLDLNIEQLAKLCKLKYHNISKGEVPITELELDTKNTKIIEYQTDSAEFEFFRITLLDKIKQEFDLLN